MRVKSSTRRGHRSKPVLSPYGFGGVVEGAAVVFLAVFGYETLTTAAEEARDPQQLLPGLFNFTPGHNTHERNNARKSPRQVNF